MTGSGAPAPRRRYGGFDVWRIGAALGVVLTHSFALTGHFEDRPHVSVGGWTLANAMTTAVASLGDPSYGIYICSYPIQQLLRHEAGITSPVAMFLLSGTIATALGYLSWHVVEKRALARIKRPPPLEPLPPVAVSDAVG